MRTNTQPGGAGLWPRLLTDRLWTASLVLSFLGLLNAGYLAWTKLTSTSIYCGPGSTACDAVSNSRFGYLADIPVSYLGFGTYLVLIALLLLEGRGEFFRTNGPIAVFGLTLFGTLFTLYLQYTSLFILREVCPYCVVNALTMAALFVLALIRLRRALQNPGA